jgi:Putative lumazine-binding
MTKLSDYDAISETIGLYTDGAYNADVATLRRAFHPEAQMFGYFGGNLFAGAIEKVFYPVLTGNPSPASAKEPYKSRIVRIDVTGDSAVAVLAEENFMGGNFTDYFSLLKIGGAWKIVNKTFVQA